MLALLETTDRARVVDLRTGRQVARLQERALNFPGIEMEIQAFNGDVTEIAGVAATGVALA